MEPPRGTKRPLPGTAVDDDGGGTGFLDESGSFVERAARGGTKEDAWLGPADDADAPAATKRARKALRKQEEDERLVEDLVSTRAVFEIQKRIVGLLRPGETVPRALRRLKESGGQTEGRFPAGAASTSRTRGSSSRMDEATRRAFDELTDAAADLLARGDLDAYSHDREAFERAAWVYEYRRRARASGSAAQEVEGEYGADRAATRSYYMDMFGDDDADAPDGTGAETAADSAGGQAVNPDQLAAAEEGGEGTGVAGWDYVYDPASGYYYSSSTGYYYDAASGYYGSASTGTWFSYDDDGGQCSGTGQEV
ncbi:unnamed protein product [Alopecurus aequalis]